MLFNTWQFLVFFPVVTLVFFLLTPTWRRWWMPVAGAVFYAALIPYYLPVILGIGVMAFAAARRIEAGGSVVQRRTWLVLGAAGILGPLAFFKYGTFAAENLATLGAALGVPYAAPVLNVALPIGLSFQAFQALAYVIDVYRGDHPAEPRLGRVLSYVLFYPPLVAGPIERPQSLMPQLAFDARFDAGRLVEGLKLIAWGLFKKMVIADRLALVVGSVYAKPGDFSGPQLALATVLFSFQIYYDFSGYTDVATGAARALGVRLRLNFNRPYAARFVGDFWGRWHVSLTTWLRDYVYVPLAGRRPRPRRRAYAIGGVFLLSGLWHGAAWHFVVWGGLHAAYLIAGTSTALARARAARALGLLRAPRLHASLRVATTFTLVTFAWIFFRASDMADALLIVSRLGTGWSTWTAASLEAMGTTPADIRLLAAVILVMEAVSWLDQRASAPAPLAGRWGPLRALAYGCLVVGILEFGVVETVPFIYAQF